MEPPLLTGQTHPRAGVAEPDLERIRTARLATVAFAAVALAVGGLFGAVAALADGATGGLGVALSLPGLWLLAAAFMAAVASGSGWRSVDDRQLDGAERGVGQGHQMLRGAIAAAAFLTAGMVGYYVGKQLLTGSVPGPLVMFWVVLAASVGLIGGAVTGRLMAEPWGLAALTAAVAGWLFVEPAAVPSAPWAEAALALVIGAAVAVLGHRRGVTPWIVGAIVGGAGAIVVLGVLPSVLNRVL